MSIRATAPSSSAPTPPRPELFAFAIACGGSVSGEHGIGIAKRGQLARQWAAPAVALHDAVKRAFDPGEILNRGKKPGAWPAGSGLGVAR